MCLGCLYSRRLIRPSPVSSQAGMPGLWHGQPRAVGWRAQRGAVGGKQAEWQARGHCNAGVVHEVEVQMRLGGVA